jgi:hypothetical protein
MTSSMRSHNVTLVGFAPIVAAFGASAVIGALLATRPAVAVALAVAVVPIYLLSLGVRIVGVFFWLLMFILAGYAFFGRGFAYLGARPVYVGDAVLAVAVLAILATVRRSLLTRIHLLLFAFMLWGLVRTVPYVGTYGIDALRDGALWGYGFFAVAISLVLRREHFERLAAGYGKLVPIFIAWVPFAALLGLVLWSSLPRWPGSGAEILSFKGDLGVHLAGVAAFLLLGTSPSGVSRRRELVLWGGWLVAAGTVATMNRGGMLAIATGTAAALLLRASRRRRVRFFAVVAVVLVGLAVVNPVVSFGRQQDASLGQLTKNVASLVQTTGDKSLDANKNFRLRWWHEIVGYTIHGPFFWTGKGFGVNLADDDGFTVDAGHTLRSPHNTHMTVLARSGVPGLALWVALQLSFGIALLRGYRRAFRSDSAFWARIMGWLFVIWLAALVETTFDPYLESPQGGIWFWSVFGLGLAALRLQRQDAGEAAA